MDYLESMDELQDYLKAENYRYTGEYGSISNFLDDEEFTVRKYYNDTDYILVERRDKQIYIYRQVRGEQLA